MVHPRAVAIFAIVCILIFGKRDYFYCETICNNRKKQELRLQKYQITCTKLQTNKLFCINLCINTKFRLLSAGFCASPKTRQEIANYLEVEPYYAARKYINPLVKSGKLKLEFPDSPCSKNQRYVRA